MFKVNNKNTSKTSMPSIVKFLTYFTPFSSVYIVDFEQVNVSWVMNSSLNYFHSSQLFECREQKKLSFEVYGLD